MASGPITSWQIHGETVADFIFGGSKITAGGDCSHEIKRHLLLERKVMTNPDSILKSRDSTFPTKVHLVKATVFPIVMYGCESWNIKKAEHQRIYDFELWCWRRLLRVPWTASRSNQSSLKEISPEHSLEGLMLKLKLQTPLATWWEELTHLKRPWCWERLKAGGEGVTEDEMVGWHYQLNGHEFDQAPGDGDGQGGLACCSPGGPQRITHDWATEQQQWQLKSIDHLQWHQGLFRYLYSGFWATISLQNLVCLYIKEV